MNEDYHMNSVAVQQLVMRRTLDIPLDGSYEVIIKRIAQTRTSLQNRALHKYLTLLSAALNDGGYSVQTVLSHAVDRDWDLNTAKGALWRPLQNIICDVESTAEAERKDYVDVFEVLNRFMGAKFGVHVPWPEREK
jgi:hypothetical protein